MAPLSCESTFTLSAEVHLKPLAGALALMFAVADPAFSQQNAAPVPAPTGSHVARPLRLPHKPLQTRCWTGLPWQAEARRECHVGHGQGGAAHLVRGSIEEVDVNGLPVIAKWCPGAVGTVTTAEAKKSMGRAGKLDVNIDSVRLVDGEKAMLSATKSAKGGGHTGAMTAGMVGTAIVFFPAAPLLLFIHGKDITIPQGTEITAFVAGDNKLDMAKFAPAGAPVPEVASGAVSAGPQMASLAVESSVAGADIEIDGSFVGNTPSTLSVAPGQHTVTVKKKGYADWTRSMNVAGNSRVHLNADMTAKPGGN